MLAVVIVAAAACWVGNGHLCCCWGDGGGEDCCGGDGLVHTFNTINRFWSTIMLTGVIVMKGEFIVVSRSLMLYDFSNDLHITKGECMSVVCQLLLLLWRQWP
jgi:hypothetical protein